MSVEKTKAGTYRARWRDDTGKQRAKSFARKVDAARFLDEARASIARGTYIAPTAGVMTVREWAGDWLAASRNLGTGGLETYQRDLDRHILPALGALALRRLTPDAIDAFLTAELVDKGLAPSTVHRHYRTLNRMCAIAVKRTKLAVNPCEHVQPPSIPKAEMRFLTAEQVEALADAMRDRYRAWVLVAAWGGLRWSETVGLRREMVDGSRLRISEQQIRRKSGEWDTRATKTAAGVRTVVLPSSVAVELGAHMEQFAGAGPRGLVFPNREGSPLSHSSFTGNVFKPALMRAGIDRATRIHDLRHTAVALAVATGAHPKVIQVRMGHASISVTLDRYGHLFPESDGGLADDLDALRRPGSVT